MLFEMVGPRGFFCAPVVIFLDHLPFKQDIVALLHLLDVSVVVKLLNIRCHFRLKYLGVKFWEPIMVLVSLID